MARCAILLAFFFVGGLAFPASQDNGPIIDDDMSIFFDHTVKDNESRIVGGTQAASGAHPWMVFLTSGRNRNFLCGGSIVTQTAVLTAAHCIMPVLTAGHLASTLRVTAGTNRWTSGGQSYTLRRYAIHPQYHHNNIKNDVGFLFTTSNIVMSNVVRVIALNYDLVGAGVAARVAGWGRTRTGGAVSDTLLELSTSTFDGQRCVTEVQRRGRELNMRPPRVDPAIEICAFVGADRGTCNGDSGSPLVRTSNGQQIGVVSWGLPCARGAPDMYARISAFRTWIQNALR